MRLPTCVILPSELTLNVAMPVLLPEHEGFLLIMAYAYTPAGSITIDPGTPFKYAGLARGVRSECWRSPIRGHYSA